ncbi:MAG: OadG family protein [Bacteroidales bacterium]|nr:OadG family protein [Bacteroidales bacterium]
MISVIAKTGTDFSMVAGFGVTTAIVGWLIVFAALVLLVIVFTQIPKLIYYNTRKKLKVKNKSAVVTDDELHITGDVNAAIAMALYMFFDEMHDEESNVITIKRVRKTYSPWSSKIYGLRVWPRK